MRGTVGRLVMATGLAIGMSVLSSTGVAFAGTDGTGELSEPWGNADVTAWQQGGAVHVEVDLRDTASDGKCVYVEYEADVRAQLPTIIAPNDPDRTVVKVCGEGESGSGSLSYSLPLFTYVDSVEFKMCKKGWAQDPCVKTVVHPASH